jgi:L-2-hydroxyglutarate oxidase
MDAPDLLIIGGGVVGLAAARAFARRHPGHRVVVLDKEAQLGEHASGRNSGVLHAGFYYTAESLKARFSRDGNREWVRFCLERGVPLQQCGKLVVATRPEHLPALDELGRRGQHNGVRLEMLSADDARRIEPRARTLERALWSPDTAVLDPGRALSALAEDAASHGVELQLGTAFLGQRDDEVETSRGRLRPGLVLNCAGAYADRVAGAWGLGRRWALVPFVGRYVISEPGEGGPQLACCVYPVPDLGLPFLGVHLTVRVDGGLKIGPTAAPARWREDYGGLGRFRPDELREQASTQLGLMLHNATFRRHAARELAKHSRTWLVREASRLVTGLSRRSFRRWGRPGIRAQLVERRTGELVQDFVLEESPRSLHVLNAVSPAFTCALPFAEHLVDRLESLT